MGFQVTRYHDICAGHRVVGHEGKCRNLHGHNYRIFFTVEADGLSDERNYSIQNGLDKVGRVLDFSVINSHLCEWLEENWDHRMLLWEKDRLLMPRSDGFSILSYDESIVVVPFNPTAENIAAHLVNVIGPMQLEGTGCWLVKVVIEETRKCSASYEVAR